METNAITMEAPCAEHSNPFFMFEVSQVCATCTNHLLTGKCYSLDTLVDQTANVNLYQVLVSQFQFKCEENGPSNICTECFSKTLLSYEFHQQCKNSVILFDKYVEWQKQFLKPDIVVLGIYDTDAFSTNVEEEQDVKPAIDIEETVISETISTNVEEEHDVKPTIDIEENVIRETISANVEEEQDVKLTIDIEETVISEAISTNVEEEQDVKLTIDIEETVISEGTLVNTNDDLNSLREVEGVESVMSCSNESTKSNVLKEESKQDNLYECTECDVILKDRNALLCHTHQHTNKYTCSYCGKAHGCLDLLKIHERLHTGEPPYPCGKCDKQCISKNSLILHQRTHTSRPFKCRGCKETFRTRATLALHTYRHIGNKQYKCTKCVARFIQSCDLKKHLQTHEKVASKDEIEDSALNLHDRMRKQINIQLQLTLEEEFKQDKLYKCTECDASYDIYSSFLSHQNVHKKRFVCSHCGKACQSPSALTRHERIHTGERPYVCGKCGKRFATKGSHVLTCKGNIIQV